MKISTHEFEPFTTLNTVETHCPCCGRLIRFVAENMAMKIESSERDYWKNEVKRLTEQLADIDKIRHLNNGYYL